MGNIKFNKRQLLKESNGRCYYCGIALTEGTMRYEHVWPKYRGGSDRMANIVPACNSCNCKKGTKFIEEWRQKMLGKLPVYEIVFYFEHAGLPVKGEQAKTTTTFFHARRFERKF